MSCGIFLDLIFLNYEWSKSVINLNLRDGFLGESFYGFSFVGAGGSLLV